jgi:hypothetical protein
MIPVQFTEANMILGEDQDDYEPLPVHKHSDEWGSISCAFRLSDQEIEELVKTRTLWHTQLTFGNVFHPVRLSTLKPDGMPL